MRRDDHVVELQQRARVRLAREHVERGARELAAPECLDERLLVDQLAACSVDESRPVAHAGERVPVHDPARLRAERQVQRQELGFLEHVAHRLRALDPELAVALLRDERVVRDDAHPETARPAGDLLTDPPEAEHAERLAGELDPAPLRALPAALLECGVRLRDVPRERDEQPDGVLRGGDDRRLGRVRDDDPAARRGLDVDVVHPDAGAADHLQLRPTLDQLGGQLRRGADHDRVVVADPLGEVAVRLDVDVEAVFEQLHARVGDGLADEDAQPAQTGAPS